MSPAGMERERMLVSEPVIIPEQEREAVLAFASFLAPTARQPKQERPALVGPNGVRHELPPSLYKVLMQVIPLLVRGEGVTVVPSHTMLTTQEAASILNVSRQYVVRLADDGKLPCTRTGSHRRLRYEDVVAYKQVRDGARRKGLRNLTRMSRELGLYDLPDSRSA